MHVFDALDALHALHALFCAHKVWALGPLNFNGFVLWFCGIPLGKDTPTRMNIAVSHPQKLEQIMEKEMYYNLRPIDRIHMGTILTYIKEGGIAETPWERQFIRRVLNNVMIGVMEDGDYDEVMSICKPYDDRVDTSERMQRISTRLAQRFDE